ncbi:hypothetical protein ACEQ8H_004367 [Pleosporales sp. CAS-2024a]
MLRPATPLSILFFIAFCLLLLSTLSTPILSAIPIATYRGIRFGVLGYCVAGKCTGPVVGYDTDKLFRGQPTPDFSLPASSRHALSSILIVHPVAALMTLICFALAVAAHFHSPAHSPRYLLALLIFTFPTLLVSLLAFLVDVLLFVPHVAWGGWVVLAATIVIVASGIVTCAMRRTLVSRKARKRRIAENDDLNGQTFYANRPPPPPVQIDYPKAESPPPFAGDVMSGQAYYANRPNAAAAENDYPKAESPPPFAGDIMSGQQRNEFASFDLQKQNSTDDTTPLNQRNPSLNTVSSGGNGSDNFMPPHHGPSGSRQPVDQYGNPLPPMPNDFGMMNGPPRGPPGPGRGGPYRGRGGPRGGPYGGGRGRGGYGPPPGGMRGPPPPGGMRGPPPPGGMRGPPPPGWNGGGRGLRPPQGVPMNGPGPGRGGPPPGYNNNYYGPGPGGPPPQRDLSPYGNRGPPPSGPMPMQMGQAIELDNRTGSPPTNGNQNYGLRESDGDVQGMLALQQGGFPANAPQRLPSNGQSPTSEYSNDNPGANQYSIAPLQPAWDGQKQPSDQTLNTTNNSNSSRGLSPIQDSPVELPAQPSQVGALPPVTKQKNESSSDYYEDVDPKFAELTQANPPPMPTSLMPGGYGYPNTSNPSFLAAPPLPLNTSDPNLPRTSSYDDLPDGSRSPAASEASHFTSVSQRPVNPEWRPDMGAPAGTFAPYGGPGGPIPRRPVRQEDAILEASASNPDFALPGMAGRGRGRGLGRGGRGGPMMGVPPPAATMMSGPGLTNTSRYPGPNV